MNIDTNIEIFFLEEYSTENNTTFRENAKVGQR